MPFKKYRSVEEMDADRQDFWCDRPDATWWRRVDQLWRTSALLGRRTYPQGLFKFRSIEELNAHHEGMLKDHVQKLRAEREREIA